jgi:hypothetical protein
MGIDLIVGTVGGASETANELAQQRLGGPPLCFFTTQPFNGFVILAFPDLVVQTHAPTVALTAEYVGHTTRNHGG